MGNLRPVLIVGLAFLGYMIWVQWQKDYGPAPQAAAPQAQVQAQSDTPAVPGSPAERSANAVDLPEPMDQQKTQPASSDLDNTAPAGQEGSVISVKTDVLDVEIDLVGGTAISAYLLDYPVRQKEPENKVRLLTPRGGKLFVAQSGLLSHQEAPNHTSHYGSNIMEYELSEGATELHVPMTWVSDSGVRVTKTYVFRPGKYEITVLHQVENGSSESWSGSRYDQLQRSVPGDEESAGFTNPGRYSFEGIGFYNPEDKFEKVDFDDVAEDPYKKTSGGGWLAMIQHYFFTAWVPPAEEEVTYSTQAITGDGWPRYVARNVSPVREVAAGESTEFEPALPRAETPG